MPSLYKASLDPYFLWGYYAHAINNNTALSKQSISEYLVNTKHFLRRSNSKSKKENIEKITDYIYTFLNSL